MQAKSYSLREAQAIAEFLKPTENTVRFQHPDVPHELIVDTVAIAPHPEIAYKEFTDNFNFMFGAEHAIRGYNGKVYRIVVIATAANLDTVGFSVPHFLDVHHLQNLGLEQFRFPENTRGNDT